MLSLEALQDAIETALKGSSTLWGATGKCRQIEPYEGQAEDYLSGKAQVIPNAPAALILLDSGAWENRTVDYSFEHGAEFSILLISGDYRGTSFRKKELYVLFDAVIAALVGKRLSLSITPIEPASWETSFEGKRHTGMEIFFRTEADEDYTIDRS